MINLILTGKHRDHWCINEVKTCKMQYKTLQLKHQDNNC